MADTHSTSPHLDHVRTSTSQVPRVNAQLLRQAPHAVGGWPGGITPEESLGVAPADTRRAPCAAQTAPGAQRCKPRGRARRRPGGAGRRCRGSARPDTGLRARGAAAAVLGARSDERGCRNPLKGSVLPTWLSDGDSQLDVERDGRAPAAREERQTDAVRLREPLAEGGEEARVRVVRVCVVEGVYWHEALRGGCTAG